MGLGRYQIAPPVNDGDKLAEPVFEFQRVYLSCIGTRLNKKGSL